MESKFVTVAKFLENSGDEPNEKQMEQLKWLESHSVPNKDKNRVPSAIPGQKKEKKPLPKKWHAELEVDEQIDLHGCTIDEALALADGFLNMCKRNGARSARIIHGHGRKSPESIAWQLKRKLSTEWKHRFESVRAEPYNSGALILRF